MNEKNLWTKNAASIRRTLSESPQPSPYAPVTDALQKATQLNEQEIVAILRNFSSMPESTTVFANPVLHQASVDCGGTEMILNIRSFAVRGVVRESEIVAGRLSSSHLIFVGLFGRRPEKTQDGLDEEAMLETLINRKFYRSRRTIREGMAGRSAIIQQVAAFTKQFPGSGPEVAIQHFSTLRKAHYMKNQIPDRGIDDERRSGALLVEMIGTHMENVAVGAISVFMRHLLRGDANLAAQGLAQQTDNFISQEEKAGKTAFQAAYSLLIGHHVNDLERDILERMGIIQTHHGSAGSNMVARFFATLHTEWVSDFYTAAQMALDGARHFGAIHDMTQFMNELEQLTPEKRDKVIGGRVLRGDLPTFGHPEIAAAGRGQEIQQDPRPAIYLEPLFHAIDQDEITLDDRQKERLNIIQRIYQIAFVQGMLKPGRENDAPLRLTPNTDFGGWSVQEALGINETDRTLLTYIFRGFGWMMDAREQLQQRMTRPVIPPDPSVIPSQDTDTTIPDVVIDVHNRLVGGDAFTAN